jgi:methyltransferase (TIGR00027 family)
MKQNRSSLTAAGIAIVRALESEKPAGERVCFDPYARRFVNAGLFYFVKLFALLGYANWKGPGVWEFLAARERYIDDYLEACLSNGLEQLVILGAGYDARAYHFDALRTGIKVFEADHPATQAVKLKKLEAIFGARPAHVTYVPIDFNQQTLAERLFESGYDERRKTLFIWQGVTQYLTPAAVDDTLTFVAGHAGPGSSIIFDYMEATLLHGAARHGEVQQHAALSAPERRGPGVLGYVGDDHGLRPGDRALGLRRLRRLQRGVAAPACPARGADDAGRVRTGVRSIYGADGPILPQVEVSRVCATFGVLFCQLQCRSPAQS